MARIGHQVTLPPIVLEGRLVVCRALALPAWRVQLLRLTPPAQDAIADVLGKTPLERRPVIDLMSREELGAISGFDFHQGCIGYADRPTPRAVADLDLQVGRGAGPIVILEHVRDPDNVGSIFRSALTFGARAVILGPGCADPFYRKAIRTSMAAVLSVPFASAEPWPDALDALRQRGFTVVATTPDAGADELDRMAADVATCDVAILIGSEATGLSAAALSRADRRVRVPIEPGIDSLTVGTAAAIVIHALRARA